MPKPLLPRLALPVSLFCTLLTATPALAADSAALTPSFSAGVRFWSNTWQANSSSQVTVGGTTRSVATQLDSSNNVVVLPSLSARMGPWSAAVGAMLSTDYNLSNGIEQVEYPRREYDVNLGYSPLPGLTGSLGYKNIRWAGQVEIKVPIASASFSLPIDENWFGYGNVAWSPLARTRYNQGTPAERSADGDYRLVDAGVGYQLSKTGGRPVTLAFTFGYRSQIITADGIQFPSNTANLKDTTAGFVMGLLGSF